jgi:hypothetical protein
MDGSRGGIGVPRWAVTQSHEGEPSTMQATTIGLDLAKSVFQLHGVDARGRVVLRQRLSRSRLREVFANLPRCLVGMEACAGAHHWARELAALGHDVRLMPPSDVRPYVKRNKHDPADAEACGEAVGRPSMRFLGFQTGLGALAANPRMPIKSAEQQSVLLLHRGRELLVRQRTQLVNALRGHLAEFGVVAARGRLRRPLVRQGSIAGRRSMGISKIGELLALVADPALGFPTGQGDPHANPRVSACRRWPGRHWRCWSSSCAGSSAGSRSSSGGWSPGIDRTRSAGGWQRSRVWGRSPPRPWSRPWASRSSSPPRATSPPGSA